MTCSIKSFYTLIALVSILAANAQYGISINLPSSLIEQIFPIINSLF